MGQRRMWDWEQRSDGWGRDECETGCIGELDGAEKRVGLVFGERYNINGADKDQVCTGQIGELDMTAMRM